MEFQQDENMSGAAKPQQAGPIPGLTHKTTVETTRKRSGWRVFWGIILAFSVLANAVFFLMLIGLVMILATGQRGIHTEELIREGPIGTKIAIVPVDGLIYAEQAENVYQQLKSARDDKRVKAVIVQVNSPGGTISASDQIHHEISKFRDETNKPIIAFMQGVAASGGYYTSVACDKIIAEPTTITGSIGVISSYLVLQELLEDKLGILPVVIKSGQKKDWPSSFREPSEQELQYIQDKLITPALSRFVNIVAEGRKQLLTIEDVNRLADGSIFGAQEALDEKLIDEIGYLDDAIELVKAIAGISSAQVVRYRRPFSLSSLLGYRIQNSLKLDRTTLNELGIPQILYLWSAY